MCGGCCSLLLRSDLGEAPDGFEDSLGRRQGWSQQFSAGQEGQAQGRDLNEVVSPCPSPLVQATDSKAVALE